MTALAWITLIAGLSCFLSFGYGVRFYFIKPEGKTLPMYLITEVGIMIALLHVGLLGWYGVWQQQLDPRLLAGTLTLFGLSLAMFWWTLLTVREQRLTFAYTKDVPQLLLAGGPYRLVRHPFYTAYMLGFFAAPLALAAWWLLPTSIFMFCLYWQAAVLEEDKFAKSELAEQYNAYKRGTGRFLPRLLPARKGTGAQ
jgi:protein-S-isoprenylcysteine O-methyltransferase Ste14